MNKFQVGDIVTMPGTPWTLEVLEIKSCDEGEQCPLGDEIFRFTDPEGHGYDWMHSSQFEKVQ